MKDRFKFRFWHKPTETMYAVEEWRDFHSILKSEATILMQCTGLKDKYGKLIYENDIVKETYFSKDSEKSEECLYHVEFDKEKTAFCLVEIGSGFKTFLTDFEYIPNDFEVIGNLYENEENERKIKQEIKGIVSKLASVNLEFTIEDELEFAKVAVKNAEQKLKAKEQECEMLHIRHSELVSESEKLKNLLADFKDVNKQLGYKYLTLKQKLEDIKKKCKEYNFSTDIYDESDILAGEIFQIIEGKENEK